MAGRKVKERLAPFQHQAIGVKPGTDEELLDEEAVSRLGKLEYTDLHHKDDEYLQAFHAIEKRSGRNTKYSTRDKLRAALAYTVTASSTKASEITGIPSHTIRYWKTQSPWWPIAVDYAIEARKEEWDAKLSEIISLGLGNTIDYLKNGEVKLVKVTERGSLGHIEGERFEQVRTPMSAKDTMMTVGIARDKQSIMRGEPTSIKEVRKSDAEMIEAMGEKIAQAVIGSGKIIEGMVIKPGFLDEDQEKDS